MDVAASPEISYSNDVKPIIITHCWYSGCHGPTENSEFQLLSYEDMVAIAKEGNDATKSQLYKVISGKGGKIMPPSPYSPLTDLDIKRILLWMKQGAKNN